MNDTPKVSVIIPVHNTGDLLKDSVGSMLDQTLEDIQIICVDDASDDRNTIKLLEEFERSDNRIEVVTLKQNVGAGGARNAGIRRAAGKYVIAFDSDDRALSDMLGRMYLQCLGENLDMCICGSYNVDVNNGGFASALVFKEKKDITDGVFKVGDLGDHALTYWDTAPWNKLVNRQFLNKNSISFQEIPSSNDVYFSVMCALKAKRMMYCQNGDPLVEYRVGRKDQISSTRNPEHLICAYKKIRNDFGDISKKTDRMLISLLSDLGYRQLSTSDNDESKRALYGFIKEEIIRSNCINLLDDGKIKENCIKFIDNEFESSWFEASTDNAILMDSITKYIASNKDKKFCIWGYGTDGMNIDKFLCNAGYTVFVTDKKNMMVGKRTMYGSSIMDHRQVLESDFTVIASKKEIYDDLLHIKDEQGSRFTVIKGFM